MKKGIKLLVSAVTLLALFAVDAQAERLTLKQENLLGLSNRFTVVVQDFAPDGALTPQSVRDLTESYLAERGIELVPDQAREPLAKIILHVRPEKNEDGSTVYNLDLNIFNLTVLHTTYKIRKGTLWMIGAFKVVPGKDFPQDVEHEIKRMLNWFCNDYFEANPYVKKFRKESSGIQKNQISGKTMEPAGAIYNNPARGIDQKRVALPALS